MLMHGLLIPQSSKMLQGKLNAAAVLQGRRNSVYIIWHGKLDLHISSASL
jgi:hypothetical protein